MKSFGFMKIITPFFLTLPAVALFAGEGPSRFALSSESIHDGQRLSINQVYNGMGAGGKNLSPQLSWSSPPTDTKSFAVTIYDPDAPTGSGWWHWVVFNIPLEVSSLPEGASGKSMPPGCIESMTDFGKPGFGGAAPPPGDKPHHYRVTVWALDIDRLELDKNAPPAQVGFNLNRHAIVKASITGLYSR